MYSRARSMPSSRNAASLFGLQRWQARNPALSAASTEEKKRTLPRFGRRDGQEGRQ
jgi:hypothetical protein